MNEFNASYWMLENTPSILAKSMFYYVQSTGHFFCNDGYNTERSSYDSILLLYTINGKGILNYRGQEYSIDRNQGFIINCNEHQHYKTAREGNWEMAWLHFNGSESRLYVEYILKNSGPVFTLSANSVIPDRIRKIQDAVKDRNTRVDISNSHMIVEMLTELMLMACTQNAGGEHLPHIVSDAVKRIENNYREGINLDLLSRELGISKYHLSRVFKKHTGFSPYEYLIKFRISQSKMLIKTTDLQICEISNTIGFDSTSHYIKIFRQHEGITPLQFRKLWIKS